MPAVAAALVHTQPPHQAWVTPTTLECPGPQHSRLISTVRLVPLEPRHAPELFAAADPELFRHSMQMPPEWSVRGFELELAKVNSLPNVVAFAIELVTAYRGVDAGRIIGRTTFMDIRPEHRGLEIGRTWISRAFHGSRVNPEIKYLMLRHAFEVLKPTAIRVQLTVNGPNLHSQAAVTKLGAVREGVLRKSRILQPWLERTEPKVLDCVYFSILDEEWPAVKSRLEARLASAV